MKALLATFLFWLTLAQIVQADTITRLYDFEPGEVIYSQEVDDEFNQLVDLINGTSLTKYLYVKNNHATDPVCRFDQTGAGPIAQFRQNGAAKVTISNVGQIVSAVPNGPLSPFSITSTSVNTNLNADMVDGFHAADLIALKATVTAFVIAGSSGSTIFGTITATTTLVTYDCQNLLGGCSADMSETGATSGQIVTIVCISTTNCPVNDTNGQTELEGNTSVILGQYDSLTLRYVTDRWIEIAHSNN